MSQIQLIASRVLLLLLLSITVLTSCDENQSSLGDFRVDMATCIPLDDSYYLLLDNGKRLRPVASEFPYRPTEKQRVFVNYTLLDDDADSMYLSIKVNEMWSVLTKDIVIRQSNNADSLGHDPIEINSLWVADDYLHISFMFNYGGGQPHAINLVSDGPIRLTPDGEYHLTFTHHAYGSAATSHLSEGLVCFDVRDLLPDGEEPVSLVIHYTDNDYQPRELRVKYPDNSAQMTGETATSNPVAVITQGAYN